MPYGVLFSSLFLFSFNLSTSLTFIFSVLSEPQEVTLELCTVPRAPVCSLDFCRVDILCLFGGFATYLPIGKHVHGSSTIASKSLFVTLL
jgi:hypothetical protein